MSQSFDADTQDESQSNEYLPENIMNFTDTSIRVTAEIVKAENVMIENIKDASTAGMALDAIGMIKERLKRMEKAIEEKVIEWGKVNNVFKCDIGGDKVLIFSKAKTNRFDTQEIYKALNVSQELIDILPKNPAFKVSAVKLNEKISHLFYEEVKDEVEVRPIITDKRFLK